MIRLPFFNPRIRTPSAVYQFLINRKPVAVSELIGRPDSLLNCYLDNEDLTCCSILGGFTVFADGKIVMDVIDEVSMSQSWLPAIICLQRGSQAESVWAWEESHMTLTRKDSVLEMEDVHHSGKVICPRTRFPFTDFVAAILNASRPMAVFVEQFHSAMAEREIHLHSEPGTLEKLQLLREEISADWTRWVRECESLLVHERT